MNIKSLIHKCSYLINHFPFNNKIKLHKNRLIASKAILLHCKVNVAGNNNLIEIQNNSILKNSCIYVYGNNNHIVLGENCRLFETELYIEDDNNSIIIGDNCNFCGNKSLGVIHLACIEGTSIILGDNCLLSSNIIIRTGDSHSITDLTGTRINKSETVSIGRHVWICNHVTINKGVKVNDDSIIGSGSIVTSSFESPNIAIAGVPAKIVKSEINWDIKRI